MLQLPWNLFSNRLPQSHCAVRAGLQLSRWLFVIFEVSGFPNEFSQFKLTTKLLKVDGTSFSDAGSLVTTAHLTREICPRKSKTNMGAQKLSLTRCFFSCLSEIGSKQKLSFGRQSLSNSVCVRKALFVAQCPKFKARVTISVAINLVGHRDQ